MITGQSVVLNSNAWDKVFTDIEYETLLDEDEKPVKTTNVYFCTASGELMRVSTQAKELEEVKSIHSGGITSI